MEIKLPGSAMPIEEDPAVTFVSMETHVHDNSFYDVDPHYGPRTAQRGKPPLWDRFLDRVLPGKKVVDIGCGSGRDLSALDEAGIKAQGFDLSERLVRQARENSRADVSIADMRDLSFGSRSLGGAIAVASLLHLGHEEIDAMIEKIAGWLAPDAPFLATMKLGEGAAGNGDGRQFTLVRREEWLERLQRGGLEVVMSEASDADPSVSSSPHDWIATLAVAK